MAAHEMHCDDFVMHEASKRMYRFVQFRSTRVPLLVRFVWCKPEVLGRRKEHLWRTRRRAQYTRMEQCVYFESTRLTLPVRFVWCKPEVLGRRKEHLGGHGVRAAQYAYVTVCALSVDQSDSTCSVRLV